MVEQIRHKDPQNLDRPREMVIVLAPMRSNVNLSRIVRLAGCCGITAVYCTGPAKVVGKIARDGADNVRIESHRSLQPQLIRLREEGYTLVGLEQCPNSTSIFDFSFDRKTALVAGNERLGLSGEELMLMDKIVEIPVFGKPFAHNVATAVTIAAYEYCRQFPRG